MIYAILAVAYFYLMLMDPNYEVNYALKIILGFYTLFGLVMTSRAEVLQLFHAFKEKKVCTYFSSFFNWIDLICIVLSSLITIHTLSDSEMIS